MPKSSAKKQYTPEEIRALRNRLNKSQYQLAQELKITQTTVARWESGRNKPSAMAKEALRRLEVKADFEDIRRLEMDMEDFEEEEAFDLDGMEDFDIDEIEGL